MMTNEEKLDKVIEDMTAFMPTVLEELKRMEKFYTPETRKGRKRLAEIKSLEERMSKWVE